MKFLCDGLSKSRCTLLIQVGLIHTQSLDLSLSGIICRSVTYNSIMQDIFVLNKHIFIHHELTVSVCDFIHNFEWNLPSDLCNAHPVLTSQILQIEIPSELIPDSLMWKQSSNGLLTFKEAFKFLHPSQQVCARDKFCLTIICASL